MKILDGLWMGSGAHPHQHYYKSLLEMGSPPTEYEARQQYDQAMNQLVDDEIRYVINPPQPPSLWRRFLDALWFT